MEHLELVLLFLLLAVVALTALARALGVPYPILLVLGGSVLGFAPGVPDVRLDPNIVLLLFLPPLLFNLAYFASVRDLRADLRTISLQAVGLVALTTCVVAVVVHAAVPALPWAAAFALGAIVSPTDPLAAVSVARRLGVPRRILTVMEGESLVNDGTALVLYRTAVAAALGGSFDLLSASRDFVVNVVGGAAIGLVAAAALLLVYRYLRDDLLGVTLSLAAGYIGYIPAEQAGVSGVIAAVVVGLVLGQRAHVVSTASARVRGYAFWEILVFLLNAVLFVLVGLQLPAVLSSQEHSAGELIGYGVLAWVAVTGTRIVWGNTMPYVVRALDRRPAQRERRVGWRLRLVSGWGGLRGSVSLAAALALPLRFPERDLLVYLTLCVILGTLVVQGLTLPWLIRRLDVHDDGEAEREEMRARKAAAAVALERIAELREQPWTREDTLDRLAGLYEFRRRRVLQRAGYGEDGDEDVNARSEAYQRVLLDLHDTQRAELVRLRTEGVISSDVARTIERELDLEDERLEI